MSSPAQHPCSLSSAIFCICLPECSYFRISVVVLTELCCCLAEVDFWRHRNTALSSLYEQLNLPAVKTYMSVLEVGSSDQNLLASFKTHFTELKKVCLHAEHSEAVLLLPIPAAGQAYSSATVGCSQLCCCSGSLS